MLNKNQGDSITKKMRKSLKTIFEQEVNQLPSLLCELEAKDRINVILKVMPFILPSVKAIHFKEGEPIDM